MRRSSTASLVARSLDGCREKYGDDFTNHPVGAGPYIVKDQIPGNSITYDRNPDYNWPPPYFKNRGPAYLDGITMKVIKEDATVWAALKAGEVHVAAIPTTYIKEADTNPNITVVKQARYRHPLSRHELLQAAVQ